MKINSYRELTVWQVSMDAVDDIYALTKAFPGNELYGLASQLNRAVVSIPSNIAEGWGRMNTKDYIRHLLIAKGSLFEVETQLEIAVRQGFITRQTIKPVWSRLQQCSKMLVKLISGLNRHLMEVAASKK